MSGYLHKLWNAVAGDGTSEEHANEVRTAPQQTTDYEHLPPSLAATSPLAR